MAKNDTILLDGIIEQRISECFPSQKKDEVFEYLSFEQILKDFDLDHEDLLSGAVDGRNDGGIDGFFIFVNGHLLSDSDSFHWPKSGADLSVWILNCKHHNTFHQAPLDKLNASFSELFDLTIPTKELEKKYSPQVLEKRELLYTSYKKLSINLNSFSINFFYVSRGDSSIVGESITARASQLVSQTTTSFSNCDCKFNFIGSTELIESYRKRPNFSLTLPFVESLSSGDNYVVLSNLKDYFTFITNEEGKLRRYLFDSNVRDFMGLNRVNEDIQSTLNDKDSPDFWWLNNGVTLLASGAAVIGKSIKLQDIQIVNGLQSTESIYRHFNHCINENFSETRSILVKVIVSTNEQDRDAIIRSTNNQTTVELASLHATEKVQRDIEEVLLRHGLYYERRKNQHVNAGHKSSEIVSPLYMAAGFVAIVLKNPSKATALKAKFMRNQQSYNQVFDDRISIDIWPKIGQLLKRIDSHLERVRPEKGSGEYFLRGLRYITAFLVLVKHFRNFNYSKSDLESLKVSSIANSDIDSVTTLLASHNTNRSLYKYWQRNTSVSQACEKMIKLYAIPGYEDWLNYGRCQLATFPTSKKQSKKNKDPISDELVSKVDALLPEQPWKPGIQKRIIRELGCSWDEYFMATQQLIESGKRFRQKDGVVYNPDGSVKLIDTDRVDPKTLKLI